MNNSIAKQLRKDSLIIANTQFQQHSSTKSKIGGTVKWDRYTPKAIYKALKKAYYTNTTPIY